MVLNKSDLHYQINWRMPNELLKRGAAKDRYSL
jgi:hypothetical protein